VIFSFPFCSDLWVSSMRIKINSNAKPFQKRFWNVQLNFLCPTWILATKRDYQEICIYRCTLKYQFVCVTMTELCPKKYHFFEINAWYFFGMQPETGKGIGYWETLMCRRNLHRFKLTEARTPENTWFDPKIWLGKKCLKIA